MAFPRVSVISGASQAGVSTSWHWLGGCAVVAAATLGCGKGDGVAFAPVEGRVTFDGQPLEAGEIRFQPDISQGNKGPLSAAMLGAGGSFTTPGVKYLTYTLCLAIVGAWHTKTLARCHPRPKKTFAVA